jgi:hypothetical protein
MAERNCLTQRRASWLGGQAEPAAELEPREREAHDARKGRGKIPSGFPLGKSEGDTEIIARPVPPWEWRKIKRESSVATVQPGESDELGRDRHTVFAAKIT